MIADNNQEVMLLIQQAALLSTINHDINNQLTIFSLSVRSIRKCGIKYNDEKLTKIANQMEQALIEIEKTLTKIQPLKNNVLVKDFKEKNMGLK
jgi:hypothetical protein